MRRAAGWWSRLWGAGETPPAPGAVARADRALAELEALVCDGAVHRPGAPGDGALAGAWRAGPVEEVGATPRGAVSVATGMALAGLRTAAFVDGAELIDAIGAIRAAADRCAPLVVHASGVDPAGLAAVAETGAFVVEASTPQEALDLTLLARWLTEHALVPGVVAAAGSGFADVHAPAAPLVRTWLGDPAELVPAPTAAQRIAFGAERRRLLAWFDPDRPVATGTTRAGAEAARGALGRAHFVQGELPALLERGARALTALTGRPVELVQPFGLDDAEVVIVARGVALEAARAVAEALRERRVKVGVLGVPWIRPFPAAALAPLLERRDAVAVLEPAGELGDPPLMRELAAAVGRRRGWISATFGGPAPAPGDLLALVEQLRKKDRRARLRLDQRALATRSDRPRREALLQAVAGAYPTLTAGVTPTADGPHGLAVGLVSGGPDASARLAAAVLGIGGGFVRGAELALEPGAELIRAQSAPRPFANPGPLAPVSVLLVPRGAGAVAVPPGLLGQGAHVVFAGEAPSDAWRRAAAARPLKLYQVADGLDALLAALPALTKGELQALDVAQPGASERSLPAVVRRIRAQRAEHDSLPRFWGEALAPDDGSPDPLSAFGAIPAGASALHASGAAALPELDRSACTACGACWRACPESALGATLLSATALLDGLGADAPGPVRRAHGAVAQRLGRSSPPPRESVEGALADAWAAVAPKLGLEPGALDATLRAAAVVQPVATDTFFDTPEGAARGSGELLVLAFDPGACVGCGLCAAACGEGALALEARTPERAAAHEARWQAWEALPDTSGASITRAAEAIGPMAAALLSRHAAHAQVGGGSDEPGSGARLSMRLVTALTEQRSQERLTKLAKDVDAAATALDGALRALVGSDVARADTDALARAVGRSGDLAGVARELAAGGAAPGFDRRRAEAIGALATDLRELAGRVRQGPDGLGRARFGVLACEGSAAWATAWPLAPWFAPVTVAPTADGVELARGLARGLATRHVGLVRALRRAALLVEAPSDLSARLSALEGLRWESLDPADRAACPPLLLLGDATALAEPGLLGQLLSCDLPVKIVLLDGRGQLGPAPEPAMLALVHRRAYVLSSSIAAPDHLARGVRRAMTVAGPALLHLHAPSPAKHGFAADRTLEQARLALEARAHLLFSWDPEAPGAFGERASLDGNPDAPETSFADWARTEARFAAHFDASGAPDAALKAAAADREAIWALLRELAGVESPFVERVRASVSAELEGAHRLALAALAAEKDAELARRRAAWEQEALDQVTVRLMALAGYAGEARGET